MVGAHCSAPHCFLNPLILSSVMPFHCNLCQLLFSTEEKLDEHQGLCSLRQSSTSSFQCHCCSNLFVTKVERNQHEFLCSLKMPIGSCFSCKFCNTRIAIHNNSSFIHHERHCLLNPSVAVGSSVLCQHHSIGELLNTLTAIHVSKKAGHNEGHPEKHSLLKK
jgi:hypothetical protein